MYRGIYIIGALKELIDKNIIIMDNIKSIYGTSIGSVIATLLALNLNWNDVIDYFINKPWGKNIELPHNILLSTYNDKGIINKKYINMLLLTFFKYKNIKYDITMLDFYNINNIELHFYTIRINDFKLIDLSHKTHPNLKVLDAIYMSCSMPILFKPLMYKDSYYIDGGLLNSYPLYNCINNIDINNKNDILGIRIIDCSNNKQITTDDNIIKYISHILDKISYTVDKTSSRNLPTNVIKNEIIIMSNTKNADDIIQIFNNKDFRLKCINYGLTCAKKFFNKL